MISFRLSRDPVNRNQEIVEILDGEKIVGVLYPQPAGVRLVSRFLQAESVRIDERFPTAVEILLP